MSPIIEVKNLKKTYPLPKGKGKFEAIKGTSFSVEKGQIFGLLGPNGAGKTTTLEILEGLKKQSSGDVKVLGFDNLSQTQEIKKRIGVQLQTSSYLPYLSLTELLDLFKSLYPTSILPEVLNASKKLSGHQPGPQTSKALHQNHNTELLKLVDLQDKASEEFKNLSGGQKQRFTIATSLVNDPEIIFLDEPTTGLDPSARRQLWELVKHINKQGVTVVLTTHYMEEAEYLCHQVAIMDEGRILEIDEPAKLIEKISQTTQVSFLTETPIVENIFKQIPEVEKIYNKFPKTIIEIKSLDHIGKIVELLKNNGVKFSAFSVKTASLEDVYLDLTGKEFEQ